MAVGRDRVDGDDAINIADPKYVLNGLFGVDRVDPVDPDASILTAVRGESTLTAAGN